MNPLKLKVLDEIIKHLSGSQANDLKGLLDESKKPMDAMGMDGKPKGLSIEKVSILGKKPNEGSSEEEKMESPMEEKAEENIPGLEGMEGKQQDPEMSDAEMEEMIRKYLQA